MRSILWSTSLSLPLHCLIWLLWLFLHACASFSSKQPEKAHSNSRSNQVGKIVPIKCFPGRAKERKWSSTHSKGVRHRRGLSGHRVGSFSGCTVFSEDFLSPRGVAVSKTEILLAFSYAQREVGSLILTYTGSVAAWLRMLEYFSSLLWRCLTGHLCPWKIFVPIQTQELLEGNDFYFTSYQIKDSLNEDSEKNLHICPVLYSRGIVITFTNLKTKWIWKVFFFTLALLTKANYGSCLMLMEALTAAARRSVFAHSQAQVSLLLANGRNANGTKSNRIALTHLPLHPKVNWPIWTNVSVTRWLFH